MKSDTSTTGVEAIGTLPWGTHFCHFYETTDDLLDILIPYFRAGLAAHEFCIWVVFEPLTIESAKDALRRGVPEADRHIDAGDILIVTPEHWYLRDGRFDAEFVVNRWNTALARALKQGYAGLRVNGIEAWVTKAGENPWREFAEYEARLNDMIAGRRIVVACTYPIHESGAAVVLDVAHTHQFTVVRRRGELQVLEVAALRRAREELARLNAELRASVEQRTGELERANEQLHALASRITAAREDEARRIARELHDELGSVLTSLRWQVELASERREGDDLDAILREVRRLSDAAIQSVRRIASELRPSVLDDLGPIEAIERHAQQFQSMTGIAVRCRFELDEARLTPDQGTAVFRIVQEALTNVLRHAQATEVHLHVAETQGEFVLSIRDNGRGITDQEAAGRLSLGLAGMQERARLSGGRLDIRGSAGRGTEISIRIPLERGAHETR